MAAAAKPRSTASSVRYLSPLILMAIWFLIVGALLILMGLLRSVVDRMPLSTGLIYLLIGIALGPAGAGLLHLNPLRDARWLEFVFEIAVLISLFTVGLKLRVPLRSRLWQVPVRLALLAMVATIALLTLFGTVVFGLPLGAALLLGATLAPTDPVLASDIQVRNPDDRDQTRFGLTGEGGLNDGTAFPFVLLALGLLQLHDLGPLATRWLAIDLLWGTGGGLGIGWLCGRGVGRLVLHMRRATAIHVGLEEFLVLGLIALAYGAALALHALGFLSVLAAGMAMRHIELSANSRTRPRMGSDQRSAAAVAGDDDARGAPASALLADSVLGFNERLEHIAEVLAVLVLGGLVSAGFWSGRGLLWALALFLLVRPASIALGLAGMRVPRYQRWLMGWFGIRGVGSLYYMSYAIHHGVADPLAHELVLIVVTVVAASIVVHGVSATPLMQRYGNRARANTK